MTEITLSELAVKKAKLAQGLTSLISEFVQETNLTEQQIDICVHVDAIQVPNPESSDPRYIVTGKIVKVDFDIKL